MGMKGLGCNVSGLGMFRVLGFMVLMLHGLGVFRV